MLQGYSVILYIDYLMFACCSIIEIPLCYNDSLLVFSILLMHHLTFLCSVLGMNCDIS